MQITQLLKNATQNLLTLTDSPRLDAEVLLAFSLEKTRTWLTTWPDKSLTQAQENTFHALLKRRYNGEPIAHITGSREFWSLDLNISKDTLIPRPETELMIEHILELHPPTSSIKLLDLGTGSGAIALAMASERPNWQITATDFSNAALKVAKQNAQQLHLTNITFFCGNWFEPLNNNQFDIIASNPPYIPKDDPHLLQGDLRFEPLSALASGDDGLDDIRLISQQAVHHLSPKGMLIIEHGYDQKENLNDIFIHLGYNNIQQHNDLSGNPRITCGLIS